jgi:hypothetical protein
VSLAAVVRTVPDDRRLPARHALTRAEVEALRAALERAPTAASFRAQAPNAVTGFLTHLRHWDQVDRQPWLRRLDELLTVAADDRTCDGRDRSTDETGAASDLIHEGDNAEVPRVGDTPQLCPVCGERALAPSQTACSARCRKRRSRAARRGHAL